MASLFFTADPVTDWHSAARSDRQAFKKFFWGCLDKGIYLAPSPYETGFISLAHTEADLDETLSVIEEVMATV